MYTYLFFNNKYLFFCDHLFIYVYSNFSLACFFQFKSLEMYYTPDSLG